MNKLNLSGVSTSVIVRAVMTVIVMINVILGYMGYHLITLTNSNVSDILDGLIAVSTMGVWLWGWWENNSFTFNAQQADAVLQALNDGTATIKEVQ